MFAMTGPELPLNGGARGFFDRRRPLASGARGGNALGEESIGEPGFSPNGTFDRIVAKRRVITKQNIICGADVRH